MFDVRDWFDETAYNYGTKGPQDKVGFAFKFKGTASDILYIYPSCPGCLQIMYDTSDNTVKGILDLSALQFNKGKNILNKYVHVILAGQPEYVADQNLVKMPNPQAKRIKLTLNGVIMV